MHIQYKKQAVKYIETCDKPTKRRLKEAIEKLPLGDVKKLSGYDKGYKFIPEDKPEDDEIEAITAAKKDSEELTDHNNINWD